MPATIKSTNLNPPRQSVLILIDAPLSSRSSRYTYRFDGKQKRLALGPYPDVTLKEARDHRENAKRALRAGVDPSDQRRTEREAGRASRAITFRLVGDELLEKKKREGKAHRTIEKVRWLLDLAYVDLGDRPLRDLSAADVLSALRTIESRGHLETAKRMRSTISEVFRYGIATARADNDPTLALRGALVAPTVTHRAAIVDRKGFGGLLRALDGFEGQPSTKAALLLSALLFQRPGELRAAAWDEFDLDEAVWTIPAERMKMRKPHAVPLPRQALAILRDLKAITGRGKLAFPGIGQTPREGRPIVQRPISENTMNAALRRLGYAQDEMSAHGFRASASTILNESGLWSPDAIEAALAHQERDAVRRAYARGKFWDERVRMGQWWADECDAMRMLRSSS
ncbi:tyrosine-type recombinase/integrase [Bosea sp. (in: a-proteobacteria)]|uniref:tyrosine-type recombinase/integrase n=1 Tax=Bosea sp. (in: a-proteobacteria) TaxID=1871050 RepID=UPI002B4A64D1|nr:tyrosine-type recombinase/integrase [Bosea sp. (in: a-proteobacteria)]WRH59303.1 MAG: tyrosine-type recombinase/integrase [Bosea sp. (in: a-proteobacteria)]